MKKGGLLVHSVQSNPERIFENVYTHMRIQKYYKLHLNRSP